MQPIQQKHRGAYLFTALLLLLSVVPLRAQPAATNRVLELDGSAIRKPFNRSELIAELKRFLKPVQSASPTKAAEAVTAPEPETAAPAEALAKRPGLLVKLDEQRQRVWPELCQSLAMDEVEQFARRLKGWAGEGHWPALHRYAEELDEQVQQFDLARLPKTLERFPEIRERLTSN